MSPFSTFARFLKPRSSGEHEELLQQPNCSNEAAKEENMHSGYSMKELNSVQKECAFFQGDGKEFTEGGPQG